MFLTLLGNVLTYVPFFSEIFIVISVTYKLCKKRIQRLNLLDSDKLTYRIHKKGLATLNQIEFFIQRKNGEQLKINKINIGWMSPNQLNTLNLLVQEQNK